MSKRRTSKFIILHSAFCILFLLAGALEAQCPPGMGRAPGTSCAVPTQGWRPSLITPVRPQQPRQVGNPAIVRVGCRDGKTGFGSGTIFDRRDGVAYVVTCEHGGKQGMFVLAGGREYPATIVQQDAVWDVIVLKIRDPGIEPLPLAETAPIRGDTVWIAGHGLGTYRHTRGQLVSFFAPSRSTPSELAVVSAVARLGDSGGPMIGPRGRIVGVISAANGRTTVGCGLPRLRRILRALLPPYPNRPIVVLPKPRQVGPMIPEKQVPVLPGVAPANAALLARVAELESQVKALQEQVAACSAEKGPPGGQGPIGKDGPRGPPGPAASAPAIDLDALAAKVLAKLPPQRVEWETLDGTVLLQEKPLGEPLRFKSIAIGVKK